MQLGCGQGQAEEPAGNAGEAPEAPAGKEQVRPIYFYSMKDLSHGLDNQTTESAPFLDQKKVREIAISLAAIFLSVRCWKDDSIKKFSLPPHRPTAVPPLPPPGSTRSTRRFPTCGEGRRRRTTTITTTRKTTRTGDGAHYRSSPCE